MAGGIPIRGSSITRTGVTVSGVPQTQHRIDVFVSSTVRATVKGLNRAALLVESEAVKLVSSGTYMAVDTGAMRAATKAYAAKEVQKFFWEAPIGVFPGKTESNWPSYTWFVHEGTSLMAGRPYIRMAMHRTKNLVKRTIEDEIKRSM